MVSIRVKKYSINQALHDRFNNKIASIDELLVFCTEHGCSDLYIKAGTRPHINKGNQIHEVPCMPINDVAWRQFADIAISAERNTKYVREKMLDFAYSVDVPDDSKYRDKYREFRYRVSAGFSQRRFTATFRMITPDMPTFESINFPTDVKEALREGFGNRTGIILLCGPTGSGKTTTLASSITDFGKEGGPLENGVLITLEDPIEYVYEMSPRIRVTQKELGQDFKSFPSGVKQALREHPTHILCGEIRDREGINVCVEASRTGHKVITTFHTDDVAGSIARMYFYLNSGENSNEAMFDLITNLDFVLCQRLVNNGSGIKLETQYVLFTHEIKEALHSIIAQGKNIPVSINKLFKNQGLVSNGVVRDWS